MEANSSRWEYPFGPVATDWSGSGESDFNRDAEFGVILSEDPAWRVFGDDVPATPWLVSRVGTNDVTVHPATVSGYGSNVTPTIGGTPIDDDPAPKLTISSLGTGTKYVYVKFEFTPTFDADGTLEDATLDAVSVLGGTTVPSDALASGTYYRTLATFVDGVKTAQVMNYSLDVVLLNKGSFASEAWMAAMASG